MKLLVQIPCFNEEETLPFVLSSIPRKISGFDSVEILIIDDGSTDRTVEVAKSLGAEHIIRHKTNQGLASAFQSGINECLALGANVIVNIDGDNQYPAAMIPELVKPIVENRADIVIADRRPHKIGDFSFSKRLLQYIGSKIVSWVTKTTVSDAPSGFRAFSRESALRIFVFTTYTYTIETILQAAYKNLSIVFVPVTINQKSRPSRLMKNIPSYVLYVGQSIVHLFLLYNASKVLLFLSLPFVLAGTVLWGRFFIFLILGLVERASNIQSILFATVSLLIGGFLVITGLLSSLISTNRQIQEETLFLLRKDALDK